MGVEYVIAVAAGITDGCMMRRRAEGRNRTQGGSKRVSIIGSRTAVAIAEKVTASEGADNEMR
jgi:hypothetical protein